MRLLRLSARVAAVAAAVVLPVSVATGPVRAAVDPVAAATAFARGLLSGDPGTCARVSASFAARFAAVKVPCVVFVRLIAEEMDKPAVRATLTDVEELATELSIQRGGGWLPRRGGVDALVRELRRGDRTLAVRSGRGAAAARAARAGVVVVDLGSTRSRLVLHTRAASGRVWTSTIRNGKTAIVFPSAVRGAPTVDPLGPDVRAIAAGAAHTTVIVPLRRLEDGSVLVGIDAAGAVDGMLLGGAAPAAGVGGDPVEAAAVAADLVAAWTAPTMAGVCRLATGQLTVDLGPECDASNGFRDGAVDVGLHALDPPVAGAATLVDVTLHVEGQPVGVTHLLTHDAAGTHVHTLFVDVIELALASSAVERLPL